MPELPSADCSAPPQLGRRTLLVGVWLISLCVLMLELAITRIFSATMYYHFAFLAVSLALFGTGASGVLVYLLRPFLDRVPSALRLFVTTTLFAMTSVVALWVILRNPLPLAADMRVFDALIKIYAATSLPFFFAGCAITLAVTEVPRDMSSLYLFDLTGAAAGCLLLIPAFDWIGAINSVILVAVLASLAALLFAASCGNRAYTSVAIGISFGLVALLLVNLHTGRLDITTAKGRDQRAVLFAKWNSFSRITVEGHLDAESVNILIDADASSRIVRGGGDSSHHTDMSRRVSALAYHIRPNADVLVIGAGGGDDVIAARMFRARKVSAVEVNPIIALDVMRSEPFRSYSGGIYESTGVELHVDEGRSFIRRSHEKYGIIQATLVDTWAATGAGAFALTENYLYTVEAFEDFLGHLDNDGILTMTRWYFEPPDQMLRLVAIARQALTRLGYGDAKSRIMVWAEQGRPHDQVLATLLVKRTPFTDREMDTIAQVTASNGFQAIYAPGVPGENTFKSLIEARDPRIVYDVVYANIEPSTDNHPFFFNTLRIGDLVHVGLRVSEWHKTNLGTVVLSALVLISAVAVLLFILGPMIVVRRMAFAGQTREKLASVMYFACLGVGFIVVEVILIQKFILFLGRPVYSLAVVLFSILLFSGIGSWVSGRIAEHRLSIWLRRIIVVLAVLILAATMTYSAIFYSLVHLPQSAKALMTVLLLAPLAFLMGMPMPIGIRMLALRSPEVVPWAWGVNGAASVLGSAGALALALMTGFDQAMMCGAAAYLSACLFVVR